MSKRKQHTFSDAFIKKVSKKAKEEENINNLIVLAEILINEIEERGY